MLDQIITIEVLKWERYQHSDPRIKQPWWFRMNNNIWVDPYHFDLGNTGVMHFIMLLCAASRKNKPIFKVPVSGFCYQYRIVKSEFLDSLSKLEQLQYIKVIPCKSQETPENPMEIPRNPKRDKIREEEIREEERRRKKSLSLFSENFDSTYKKYPVRCKGSKAEERFKDQIKTDNDLADLNNALDHYVAHLKKPDNSWRRPKQTFAAFLGTGSSGYFWRDFISQNAGDCVLTGEKEDTGIEAILKRRGKAL